MGRKENQTSLMELCWNLTESLQSEAVSTLFGKSEIPFRSEERGFLGIIYAGTGIRRRSLFLGKIVKQEAKWVYDGQHGLSFSPRYFSRALDEVSLAPAGAGMIIVHSHPFPTESINSPPNPSNPDLKHEKKLLFYVGKSLQRGAPLASGIITPNGAWRVREYQWKEVTLGSPGAYNKNFTYQDASIIRIVSSDKLEVIKHYTSSKSRIHAKAQDSTIRLWGEEGQAVIGNMRVGIAGLGGVGSILVEFLARLGVGELILVDFDVVGIENMNRLVGAKSSDIGRPKIEYAKRIARGSATSKNFKLTTFQGSVAEKDGLERLLDSDVIMNAADSAFARQVLDHVAYSFEIPVIDGGSKFIPAENIKGIRGKSQVSIAGPGFPCLECSGVYNQEEATLAREDNTDFNQPKYIIAKGLPEERPPQRNPSVISYNGLVASIMIQRFLGLTLGFPPDRKIGQQRYYVEEGILNWGPIVRCEPGCQKSSWIGLGDSHYVPIGIDLNWRKMRQSSNRKSDK